MAKKSDKVVISRSALSKTVAKAILKRSKEGVKGGRGDEKDKQDKANDSKFSYTRLIRSMASGNPALAEYENSVIKRAAMAEGNPGSEAFSSADGGAIVPREYSAELIELIRPFSAVRRTNARIIPMTSLVLDIPRQQGSASAAWVGENAEIKESELAFGTVTLTAKKLVAMVQMSNELLADSSPAIEAIVREDLARVLGTAEDVAFLQGAAAATTPNGFFQRAADAATNTGSIRRTWKGTNGGAPTFNDMIDMESRLEQSNVNNANYWVMHPRTKATLRKIQDGEQRYIYEQNVQMGQPDILLGKPVVTSTNVSIAQTRGTANGTASWILLGDFQEAIIGQRMSVQLAASTDAGTAFEHDQTWVRAIMRVDLAIRHEQAFEILAGVTA